MAEGAVRLWERVGLVQRLLLVIGLIVILAAAGAVALSAHHATQDARADLAREFDQQAEILSYALAPAMNTHDPERLSQALSQVRREPSVVRIGFRDVSDSAEYTQTSPVELRAPQWFARWCGTSELEGTQPVFINDTYHGILTLALTPIPTINHAWERVVRQLGILGWLLGLVTLGVWLVLQSGLRPLGTLAKGSRALSEGDFSVRLPLRGSPELRQSVAGFNRMAAALESLVKELQANNAALAHNEENLRVTLRSIGDGVIVTDASGLVVMLNPVAETLTGWPEAEARGKPVREVFHIINESTRREVQSPVTEVLRHGVVVGLANHTLLVTRDGEERPIADSGAPIRLGEDGEIQGVVLVFRDQTADRDRMRALEERERRYASLAQAAPVGI
ncbi:MAG: PAS domain-containing protein, partial [Rhodocyclaceae bacterium]|nr:PAS domain-containing protein [Rhodocyclaceae bacterium]